MSIRVRRFLHYLAANLAHYSGLLRWGSFYRRRILCRPEVYVLGLHRVLTEQAANQANSPLGMILKEMSFAKMLEYITRRSEIISLDALLDGAPESGAARPQLLLTFDDGWRDNYSTTYPWLKKFAVPAVIFVSVGVVQNQEIFWIERLSRAWKDPSSRLHIQSELSRLLSSRVEPSGLEETIEALKRMPSVRRQKFLEALLPEKETIGQQEGADQMLRWDQIIEMSRDGVEFGSHTVTHPLLTYEDDTTVKEELCVSKRLLEERLGRKVRAFAYPNGDCNEAVKQQVREAEYECAFLTGNTDFLAGRDLLAIRRVLLHDGNVTGLDGQFSAAMFWFTLARSS